MTVRGRKLIGTEQKLENRNDYFEEPWNISNVHWNPW